MNAAILAVAIYAGVIAAGAVVGGYGARDERTTVARPSAVDRRVLVTSTVQPTSEGEPDAARSSSVRMVRQEQAIPSTPLLVNASSSRPAQASPALPPVYTRDVGPTDRVRVLTVEQWRATLVFPVDQQYVAARTLICESGGNPRAVGAAGERGSYQILERFHGSVPDTLEAQAEQAARIVARESWRPWTTKEGCEQWER